MISVPYTIKNLYHQDHCYKNIRIHFPNGERTDICNSLIVKDSVSFTESLCSQNQLKFGLCEASIFECEVVGVGNIKGAKIEVSVEIECPFSAPGAEWKTDLQKYVYSIPYGTFVVDSCKRQADMQHRKIVAYSSQMKESNFVISQSEIKKVCVDSSDTPLYTPNAGFFLAANNFNVLESVVDKTAVSPYQYEYTFGTRIENFRVTYVYYQFRWASPSWDDQRTDYQYLFEIDQSKRNQDYRSQVIEFINRFDNWASIGSRFGFAFNNRIWYGKKNGSQIDYVYGSMYSYDNPYFYPFADGYFSNREVRWYVLKRVIITAYEENQAIDSQTFYPYTEDPIFYKVSYKNDYSFMENIKLSFSLQSKDVSTMPGETNVQQFPNFDECNLRTLVSDLIELRGLFGYFSRGGAQEFRLLNIQRQFGLLPQSSLYPDDDVYPESVTGGELQPRDYESCWYDDEYTPPYGRIDVTYKIIDPDNVNKTIDYALSYYFSGYSADSDESKYSVYDLSNNAIVKNRIWTHAEIEDFCEMISTNLNGVSYMPVEFVGRGLPYVEAGDTFEILTRSNDSITTIVLNRTLTGEMTLKDTYKSV